MKPLAQIPILKRWYPSLMKAWARITWTGGYKVKRYNGLLWLFCWRNMVDRNVALLGGYEKEQIAFLLSKMAGGYDAFIDIGANFGLYTVQIAASGRAKELHAFEPDPRNFAQLNSNLYLNKMTGRVTTHPFAVSAQSGELRFDAAPEKSTGKSRVMDAGMAADGTEMVLQARALDDVFTMTGCKIAIKIDVEGHENDVLAGAGALLAQNDCVLQIEAWPENADALCAHMAQLGYARIHTIDDDFYFAKRA